MSRAKIFAAIAAFMITPPIVVIATGTLGQAVVAGILSIFGGMIAMSVVVSKWEFFQRRAIARGTELPAARLLPSRRSPSASPASSSQLPRTAPSD
jgi:hypothetical protein